MPLKDSKIIAARIKETDYNQFREIVEGMGLSVNKALAIMIKGIIDGHVDLSKRKKK